MLSRRLFISPSIVEKMRSGVSSVFGFSSLSIPISAFGISLSIPLVLSFGLPVSVEVWVGCQVTCDLLSILGNPSFLSRFYRRCVVVWFPLCWWPNLSWKIVMSSTTKACWSPTGSISGDLWSQDFRPQLIQILSGPIVLREEFLARCGVLLLV